MSFFDTYPLAEIVRIADEAGTAISAVTGDPSTVAKADGSPLTAADLASHQVIMSGLTTLSPDIPILSEESSTIDWGQRKTWTQHWLVDPLDGTKEFLTGSGEYTVNIAFIDNGIPAFGIVGAPALGRLYWGGPGLGAWRRDASGTSQPIRVDEEPPQRLRIVASRHHRGPDADCSSSDLGPTEVVDVGSSLKFCLIAEGQAHAYPRTIPTMEWDTAAGHAVLLGAGGVLRTQANGPLRYGRQELRNPPFLATATEALWTKFFPTLPR